nr:MAG TPA: hypothetical protein [Caudoviricetes sp.]
MFLYSSHGNWSFLWDFFFFIDFSLLHSYSGYTGHCHARVFQKGDLLC